MAVNNDNVVSVGMTVCGLAGIALVYFIANFVYQGIEVNATKTQKIRVAKIEACRTITDEHLRMDCIVLGGLKASE